MEMPRQDGEVCNGTRHLWHGCCYKGCAGGSRRLQPYDLAGVISMASVLVVDDERCIRRGLSLILGRDGHRVVEARDGSEAFHKLGMMSFDVAIVDLRLPDVDGLEIVRAARGPGRQSEVVVITASTTPEVRARAIEVGACQVLTKPFTGRELRQAVDRAITRRLRKLEASRTTAGAREGSSYGAAVAAAMRYTGWSV
jgi:DNA-binding response OmpR family regulator